MSGNLCHQGGGGQRLMAKTILDFHFNYLTPSLGDSLFLLAYENQWEQGFRSLIFFLPVGVKLTSWVFQSANEKEGALRSISKVWQITGHCC